MSTITGYTSAFNFKVNGVSQGSLYLEAQGGIYDGSTYVYLPVTANGKTWLNNNLGANYANKNHANFAPGTQATASSDADAYGSLYQWGRGADGHESRTSGTTTTTSAGDDPGHGDFIMGSSLDDWRTTANDALWIGVNGTNNPCPTGYRVPTETELSGLGISNSSTAYSHVLKLTTNGYRDRVDASYVSGTGMYWTSRIGNSRSSRWALGSSYSDFHLDRRTYGFGVRCIKD